MKNRSVFVHELLDPSGSSLRWLEERGITVVRGHPTWEEPHQTFTPEEIIQRGQGHVALMGASTHPITKTIIDALPELRYISKYGRGVDAIDLDATNERGILVANTPIDSNFDAVAEHTIASILYLTKQLHFYTPERLRAGGWRTDSAWSHFLRGSTIGIVGMGQIGRAVVRRLTGWGVNLLGSDPYIEDGPDGVKMVGLDALLSRSDVVSLHAVVTQETYHMIGVEALGRMKRGAYLVNTARGGLMDLDAVDAALESGHLAGVAMDAYEVEPPPRAHLIFRRSNVLATPHLSAWTQETFEEIAQVGAENLWAMLNGELPRYCVNPEVLSRGRG